MENQSHSSALPTRLPSPLADCLLAASLGLLSTLSWIAVCVLGERHEAWDSGAYFAVILPVLCVASGLAGWRRPAHAWRWPSAIVAGQVLGLGITTHGSMTLGPLPLIALAVLGVPYFIAASLARKRARRS